MSASAFGIFASIAEFERELIRACAAQGGSVSARQAPGKAATGRELPVDMTNAGLGPPRAFQKALLAAFCKSLSFRVESCVLSPFQNQVILKQAMRAKRLAQITLVNR